MDEKWLKTQLRLHPERNKADLARALGLAPAAISKILAGKRQIKATEYLAMRRFFGMTADGGRAPGEFAGMDQAFTIAPLDSALREQPAAAPAESWVMPASLFETRTRAAPEQIRIYAVSGDAMLPDFRAGEQVLVDLSDRLPSPAGVFIVSDGLAHIIRQCEHVPHSNPSEIRVSALNSRYGAYVMNLDKAGIVGRVIAKLQWL